MRMDADLFMALTQNRLSYNNADLRALTLFEEMFAVYKFQTSYFLQ